MIKNLKFAIVRPLCEDVRRCLSGADTKTDYALRRTMKSMESGVKTALESCKESLPKLREYEAEATKEGGSWSDASEKFPESAKAHRDLMELEIPVTVHQLPQDALDKDWPHSPGEGVASAECFCEVLAELELVKW